MQGFIKDLTYQNLENTAFRRVVHTGQLMQVAVMCLAGGTESGMHVHPNSEQAVFIFHGQGNIIQDGEEQRVVNGDAVVIPAGVEHNLINTGTDDLRIVTVSAPAPYPEGAIHRTQAEEAMVAAATQAA